MKILHERTPPQQLEPITCTISGALVEHIKAGAALSGLTPQQYVLSLLWHNVPLKQARPSGLPDCVQLVLNDIYHHYVDTPFTGVQDPYEAAGMTREDFCGSANDDKEWDMPADDFAGYEINDDDLPF